MQLGGDESTLTTLLHRLVLALSLSELSCVISSGFLDGIGSYTRPTSVNVTQVKLGVRLVGEGRG